MLGLMVMTVQDEVASSVYVLISWVILTFKLLFALARVLTMLRGC